METENEEITSPVQTTNSSSSLESLIEKNWKTLSLIIVASLIIFAVLYFYNASNDDKALARGQELVTASMDDSSISSLLEFASTNEGTVSGNNAKLIIAERYTNGNSPDLDKAKQYLSEFIATADQTNPFYYDAKFSLATLLEKTGNAKEAKTIFEEVASTESNSKNAAKIRLADLLVQNKEFDKAIDNYEDAGKATNYTQRMETSKIPDAEEAKERSLTPPPPLEPEEPAEEPAPEAKAEEPAPKPKVEEPAPEPNAEEPASEPKVEEPAPEPKTEEPAPEPKAE